MSVKTRPTVWLTTLGCAKNQVDSEKINSMLAGAGYQEATDPATADVVMVNTCAFIEEARQESLETIAEAEEVRSHNSKLVVLGCMAGRHEQQIIEHIPTVDEVMGLDRYSQLVDRLDDLTGWTPVTIRPRAQMDILFQTKRPTPELPYAYVKVAEGCDKTCTFCAIPLIRGKQQSRPIENIATEVSELAEVGVKEVVLVAQDLAAYGRDMGSRSQIVALLQRLSEIDKVDRYRLLYLYPTEIRPKLIAEMTTNPKVAPYFDLSLQHVSPSLLRPMRRPGSVEKHLALIESIRDQAPTGAFRSSFIVGFPGETEADVEMLAEFLPKAQLDWAGFFAYSPERDTPAYERSERVRADLVAERVRYLTDIQAEITSSRNAAQIDRTEQFLVDQYEDNVLVGRSFRHAPEIDGVVTLDRGEPGQWVEAKVVGTYGTEADATVTKIIGEHIH